MRLNRDTRGIYQNSIETDDNIKEAFLTLLQEKDLNEITISDIAKKACIERSTFYFHYNSIDSLVMRFACDVICKVSYIIRQTGESAITAFPYVILWLANEFSHTPCCDIMQSKYWYKMHEMLETAYLSECVKDIRLRENPDIAPRIMVKAQLLVSGTLCSLEAYTSERFKCDAADLVSVLIDSALQFDQEVQKICK